MGTRRLEDIDGVPCVAENTKPMARVALSTQPYNFEVKPSLVTMTAINGVEFAINFWMHKKNSVDEMSFLVMVENSESKETSSSITQTWPCTQHLVNPAEIIVI